MLSTNVGGWDRILRVLAGAVLLALVFVGPRTMWGLAGIVPLLAGLFGTCPIYSLFGIKTCRAR